MKENGSFNQQVVLTLPRKVKCYNYLVKNKNLEIYTILTNLKKKFEILEICKYIGKLTAK